MTDTPLSREELQALANQPLGNRDLQAEAERIAHRQLKPSPELKAVCKRIAKKWLPAGKKAVTRQEQQEADRAFYANQTDIEDAVEQHGGRRGTMGKAA